MTNTFHNLLFLLLSIFQTPYLEHLHGFINLEQALKAQGAEIKQLILQIAQDMKFAQHHLVLVTDISDLEMIKILPEALMNVIAPKRHNSQTLINRF